jgi:hypothetical protein
MSGLLRQERDEYHDLAVKAEMRADKAEAERDALAERVKVLEGATRDVIRLLYRDRPMEGSRSHMMIEHLEALLSEGQGGEREAGK